MEALGHVLVWKQIKNCNSRVFRSAWNVLKDLRQTYLLGFEYKSEYTKHKNIVMTHKDFFKSVDPQPFINSCGAAFFSPLTLSAVNYKGKGRPRMKWKEMFESEKEKQLQNQWKIQYSESAVDNDLKKKKNIIQTFQIMHVDTHLVSLQSSWD